MSVDFQWRDFFQPAEILRLKNFFDKSQWFSREECRAYQENGLREIVAHAYAKVPYYRRLFDSLKIKPGEIRHLEDLRRIPILDKQILRSELASLEAEDAHRYHPRRLSTTGTSGEPVTVLMDRRANALEFVYYWRYWNWAGYRLGDRFAEISTHYFLKRGNGENAFSHFQPLNSRLLLNGLRFSAGTAEKYVTVLRKYRPKFLKGLASALYYFSALLRKAGVDDLCFGAVFSTGEILSEGQRKFIQETFRCKVFNSYGHMERLVAASDCPEGHMHIHEDYGILEIEAGKDTSGIVIGTSFYNRSMPFLRYRIGDRIELCSPEMTCPCGRTSRLVRKIFGREEDAVITPEGEIVTALFTAFDDAPGVLQGQIIQHAPDRLTVRIVRAPSYGAAHEERLRKTIESFIGPGAAVVFQYLSNEEMKAAQKGKFRVIVSEMSGNFVTTGEAGT